MTFISSGPAQPHAPDDDRGAEQFGRRGAATPGVILEVLHRGGAATL